MTLVIGKKPSRTTGFESRSIQSRRDRLGQRLEPREGTGDRTLGQRVVIEEIDLGLAGGVDQREKLPGIDRLSRRFELRLQRIGQRQIHVVAAEQNVFADTDALDFKIAILFADGDQAEIGCSSADIADQDDVSGADLAPPRSSRPGRSTRRTPPAAPRAGRPFRSPQLRRPRR